TTASPARTSRGRPSPTRRGRPRSGPSRTPASRPGRRGGRARESSRSAFLADEVGEARVVADRPEVLVCPRVVREVGPLYDRGGEVLERCVRLAEPSFGAGDVVEQDAAILVPVERLDEQPLRRVVAAGLEQRQDLGVRLPRPGDEGDARSGADR